MGVSGQTRRWSTCARGGGTGLAAALTAALVLGVLAPGVSAAAPNERAPRPEAPASERPADSKDEPAKDEPAKDESAKDEPAKDEPALPAPLVPVVPDGLPIAVDPLAGYQGQGICDPTPKQGSEAFADLIKATYGSLATSVWIPRDCSVGGRSEHKEGRALDWMINRRVKVERKTAEAFIDWLLATDENGNEFAMARRLGVMYIGWDDRIWESYRQSWSELKGCFSTPEPGFDNYCHRNHIHISLSWDGAAGQTSFWGGPPAPLPFCNRWASASAQPMAVGNGLDFVATTPRRVLDTRSGLGVPGGEACRLTQNSAGGPGAPVALTVSELKGAPEEGVRAVAVRAISVGSNSPATLRAATFDGGSVAPIRINGRTETVTVVPVGTDGTIAFTTDSGATHLLVDVLGYFVKPVDGLGGRLTVGDDSVIYDSADDTVLGPGQKRVISLATGSIVPTGALLAVTITDAEKNGELVVREAGGKRTSATPVLSYRRLDVSTQTVLTDLDDSGNVVLVNRGLGAIQVRLSVQAAAVPAADTGALVVPVAPTRIEGRRTALRRVMRDALGSVGVVVQVDAQTMKKAASITYWSGTQAPTTVRIGRQATQSSLIVVPLSDSGLIMREIVGEDVEVSARIVAYLR